MVVRELIEILKGFNPEAEVLIHDFETMVNCEVGDIVPWEDDTVTLFAGESIDTV